jgi:hypothetical protein
MGHTIQTLAEKKIEERSIFNNRFVVEICEKCHTHYRNLRIVQSLDDWVLMAEGFRDALERWKKRGCPGTGKDKHIELCRKNIVIVDQNDKIQVNLNHNLYNEHKDQIFSEGANFTEEKYIHLKIRDLRLEMSVAEFKELANCVTSAKERLDVIEANQRLENSSPIELLPQA